ncbi:uncharacterized protein FIBRA_06228 [Fibroporia radiculosa]|uniref:Terpene synthase n=1 Tax=Fibroporia radiculosa TaxID=599839 RepID=J4H3Y8_9APHY|nr:uncharacterized protein FIBRA_06228 [Fibroporia radiculosa]CCM04069.1 predicted protein [Fibroporia radiculosa]
MKKKKRRHTTAEGEATLLSEKRDLSERSQARNESWADAGTYSCYQVSGARSITRLLQQRSFAKMDKRAHDGTVFNLPMGRAQAGTREHTHTQPAAHINLAGQALSPLSTSLSDMPEPIKMLYLPETMANWPWPRMINPYYEEVKAASNAWFRSFNAFKPESQRAFDKCDFCRLASLAYPWSRKEHLRTGCDLMNVFFVIDEYTDVEDADSCRMMVDIVIDALNNPHKPRPDGEILLGEVTRQFWALAVKTASPSSQRHFIESFTAYLESVVSQAADRDSGVIRDVDSYLANRRENIGARPSYVPLELGIELPDEVFYHPVIVELSIHIADLIIFDNDLASYNKEQAHGDDQHNILTVIMHQYNYDIDKAMAWLADFHAEVETKFLDGLKRVPSWGPAIDRQVEEYLLGLANWPRCNDCWNFESGRYFGSKGLEIQKTRTVQLMPKKVNHDRDRRREDVDVPLVDI